MLFDFAQRHQARSWSVSRLPVLLAITWLGLLSVGAGCDNTKSAAIESGKGPKPEADAGDSEGPSELPGGYKPSEPCGPLGNTCSEEKPCTKGYSCRVGVCLPDPKSTDTPTCSPVGCPAEAPLCVADVCLSPDQLACVCLSETGREVAYQCASVREPAPKECIAEQGLCDARPDACCDGLVCMGGKDADGKARLGLCLRPCEQDDSCPSRCCAESSLYEQDFCSAGPAPCVGACKRRNELCGERFDDCCRGLVCMRSDADPVLAGCQLPCERHSDCDSNCCFAFTLEDGGVAGNGLCAPEQYCQK